MDVLHKSEVTPDQIDHLGHMNVRYYGANARTGAEHLLASVGLGSDRDRAVVQRDAYVRHHREQLLGAPLEVRGGVLDATRDRIRLYEELVNADTADVAATFVLTFEVTDVPTGGRTTLDDAIVDRARSTAVDLPDHGRPRSIDLDADPVAAAPSLAALTGRDLAMRQVRTIAAAECGADGVVEPMAIAELVWGGEPVPGREFRPLEPLPDGSQMGFATMETRATWGRFPRVGDRVQSFGCELDISAKTMLTGHWLYDVDRAELVGAFTVVSVAFDIGARRAIVIPDDVRARMGRRLHADLA